MITALLIASLAGFLVGFLVGIVLDDALDLYRAARKERNMTESRSGFPRAMTALLAIAVVANFLVGLLLIQTRAANQDTADKLAAYTVCTNEWQQQFATAYRVRLAASRDVSEALDAIMIAVDKKDPEKFKAALNRYLTVRETQEVQRKKNPLPPLPDRLCGQPPKDK